MNGLYVVLLVAILFAISLFIVRNSREFLATIFIAFILFQFLNYIDKETTGIEQLLSVGMIFVSLLYAAFSTAILTIFRYFKLTTWLTVSLCVIIALVFSVLSYSSMASIITWSIIYSAYLLGVYFIGKKIGNSLSDIPMNRKQSTFN